MDMLEPGLDAGSQDKTNDSNESDDQVHLPQHDDTDDHAAIAVANQGAIAIDPSVQYQFRTDTPQGQVTYRVVQVAQDGETPGAQVVATNAFSGGAQVRETEYQAVIQSPFSNGGSPTPDGLAAGETKFAYMPAGGATAEAIVAGQAGDAQLGQVTTAGGQFYVMMSPQDVLQGQQRNIAPRTQIVSPKLEAPRSTRDERRRATHNEVERRRRDKINNWIMQLSKLVPDCGVEMAKAGQVFSNQSKGGILAKACDYITELRTANARMAETLKETERLAVDVELLRQQCEELKQENSVLRSAMGQHGIVTPDLTGSNS